MKKFIIWSSISLFWVTLFFLYKENKIQKIKSQTALKIYSENFLSEFEKKVHEFDSIALKSLLRPFARNHAKKPLIASFANNRWNFSESLDASKPDIGYFFKNNQHKTKPYWVKFNDNSSRSGRVYRVIPHLEDIKVFEIAEFEKVFFEKNKNLSIRFKDLNQQSDRILFFEIPSFIENKGTTFFSEDRCILEKTIEGFDSPLEITLIQENKIKQALLITGALLLGFLQIIIFSIRTRKKVALVVTTGLIFYLSSSQLGKIQHQHAATKKNTQLALIAYKAGTERFKEHVLAVSQYLMDCFESDHTLIHHQNVFDKWPYLKNIRYENSSNFTLVELKNPKNKTQPSLISIFQKWEGWQAPKQTQDSTSYFFSLKNKEAYVILEIDPFPVVRPIEVIEQLLSIRCDLKAQLTDQNSKNQIDFYIDVIPRSKLNPKNLCCILLTLVSGLATLTSYLSCILGTVQIGYFSATGFTKRPTLATFNKNI